MSFTHLHHSCPVQVLTSSDLSEDQLVSFAELYQQTLRYRQDLETLHQYGMEGVGDVIRRILTGLFNTIFHLIHTFKTNIFRFYRDLKRTELRYYHESNSFSIKRILTMDYVQMSSLSVPIPEGMICSYLQTTDTLDQCLTAMNMPIRAQAVKDAMSKIRDRILARQDVGELLGIKDDMFDLRNVAKEFARVQLCLTKKRTTTIRFSQAFPDATAFPATDARLLAMEHHQLDVSKVFGQLNDIEGYANTILDFLTKAPDATLTKDDLQALSVICTALAKLFDMYGVTVQDQHRVEHNFVECLKVVRRTFDL